jgi:hypothetical protein
MMQFDIIDETSHVQYGRDWLPELQRFSGVQEDFKARGAARRAYARRRSDWEVATYRATLDGQPLPANQEGFETPGDVRDVFDAKGQAYYAELCACLRARQPLKRQDALPLRPNLPM